MKQEGPGVGRGRVTRLPGTLSLGRVLIIPWLPALTFFREGNLDSCWVYKSCGSFRKDRGQRRGACWLQARLKAK